MKSFSLSLIGLFFIPHAISATLHLTKLNLGTPYYRSISSLIVSSASLETGSADLIFYDKYEKIIDSLKNLKIKKSDYQNCSSGYCLAKVSDLPLSIEKYTCSFSAKLKSSSGTEFYSSKISWGDCLPMPATPDPRFLADLAFTEDTFFTEKGEILIENLGASINSKPLTVWGMLKDKNGKIIWSGSYTEEITIKGEESILVNFSNTPKNWHNHLACSGTFIIDPEFTILERKKINNVVNIDYGLCEDSPSEEAGDRIDFEPRIAFVDGLLSVFSTNKGKLPYTELTTRLETSVHYLDSSRNILFLKNIFIEAPLYGFEDTKLVMEDFPPEGTCFIQIELNPNLIIKESDYFNNKIEINICE